MLGCAVAGGDFCAAVTWWRRRDNGASLAIEVRENGQKRWVTRVFARNLFILLRLSQRGAGHVAFYRVLRAFLHLFRVLGVAGTVLAATLAARRGCGFRRGCR